jgi:chromosome segregation ATPase
MTVIGKLQYYNFDSLKKILNKINENLKNLENVLKITEKSKIEGDKFYEVYNTKLSEIKKKFNKMEIDFEELNKLVVKVSELYDEGESKLRNNTGLIFFLIIILIF